MQRPLNSLLGGEKKRPALKTDLEYANEYSEPHYRPVAATSSADPVCCADIMPTGADDRLRDVFALFRWRLAGWNLSFPALLTHLWELLVVVCAYLSLINRGIPSSPGLWVPITLLVATFVYLLFTALAYFTMPDVHAYNTKQYGTYIRAVYQQGNDALHLRIGTGFNVFVTIFYFVWYYDIAGATTPINPLLNPSAYVMQQMLHVILLISHTGMFFGFIGINGGDSRVKALIARK